MVDRDRDGAPLPTRARLESFRVRMFRSVIDSGDVPVFALTALVGRSAVGKTSLLHALGSLGPGGEAELSMARDWPAGRRSSARPDHVVCSVDLELPLDRPACGGLDPRARRARVGRGYDGRLRAELTPDDDPRPVEAGLLPAVLDLLPAIVLHDAAELGPDEVVLDGTGRRVPRSLAWLDDERRAEPERLARRAERRLRTALRAAGSRFDVSADVVDELPRLRFRSDPGSAYWPPGALSDPDRWRLALDLRLADAHVRRPGPAVVLLDRPGVAFRGAADGELRGVLAELSARHTVLYTARLPHRLALRNDEQLLVVSPGVHGSAVRPALAGADGTTLRASLGMTGAASYRVGDLNLVVEGPTDAQLLEALSALLRRGGEPGLPEDLVTIAAGGAHEVVEVARFLVRAGLAAVALLDADPEGRRALQSLERSEEAPRRAGARCAVLSLATAAELENGDAAIEDVFSRELYLEVARKVCRRELAGGGALSIEPGGRVATRLRAAFAKRGLRFPKGAVATELVRHVEGLERLDDMHPRTASRVRRLVGRIRAEAEALRPDAVRSSGGGR